MILALLLAAAPAVCPAITRHASSDAKSVILQGVTIPAGSETFFTSGLVAEPIDAAQPATTLEAFGDTRTQALSIFGRMKVLLANNGYGMGDIVKLTVFIAGDAKLGGKMDFKGFNDAYKMHFGTTEQPKVVARSTVQVAALAAPMYLIEIEAVAARASCGR